MVPSWNGLKLRIKGAFLWGVFFLYLFWNKIGSPGFYESISRSRRFLTEVGSHNKAPNTSVPARIRSFFQILTGILTLDAAYFKYLNILILTCLPRHLWKLGSSALAFFLVPNIPSYLLQYSSSKRCASQGFYSLPCIRMWLRDRGGNEGQNRCLL